MKLCNKNIEDLIDLANKLLSLSDRGDLDRDDDSCGVLYGCTRDAAYKILELAKQEKDKHVQSGKWE